MKPLIISPHIDDNIDAFYICDNNVQDAELRKYKFNELTIEDNNTLTPQCLNGLLYPLYTLNVYNSKCATDELLQNAQDLKMLTIPNCQNITTLHHTPKLKYLNMANCQNIKNIDSLTSLKCLNMKNCTNLCRVPESVKSINIEGVQHICLPQSLENLIMSYGYKPKYRFPKLEYLEIKNELNI